MMLRAHSLKAAGSNLVGRFIFYGCIPMVSMVRLGGMFRSVFLRRAVPEYPYGGIGARNFETGRLR